MDRLEKDIESDFGTKLSTWAYENGFNVVYVKFTGAKGWPDRILTWGDPGGPPHLMWVEWKRPDEEPRPMQRHIHKILRSMGHEVRVYDDYRIALAEVQEEIKSTARAGAWNEADSQRGRCEVIPPTRKRQDLGGAEGVQCPKETKPRRRANRTSPAKGSDD